jgi:hypothetical protein
LQPSISMLLLFALKFRHLPLTAEPDAALHLRSR